MSLREKLARRLQDVAAEVDVGHVADLDFNDERVAEAVANECIRQMRWVQTAHRWSNPETVRWETEPGAIWQQEEVTIAPADWPPSEDEA